jgi:nucleotide-binding universal stress UspA family protein
LNDGKVIHTFHYENILLWEVTPDVLKQKGLEGLLPLLPLTKGAEFERDTIVYDMIDGLRAAKRDDMLALGYAFAGLAYETEEDKEALRREKMRVLCCLDGTNSEEVGKAVAGLVSSEERTVGLLYVVDSGPHGEMERKREGLMRPRRPSGPLHERMHEAETFAAQDVLNEGLRYLPGAEMLQREGRPEREIVQCAAEWRADLIVICPRSPRFGGPALGPKSVGHVARFVLDHAPCPILLVRPVMENGFSLPR